MNGEKQVFSDDDLTRLKESLETYEDEQQQCYSVKEFKALLSRLEAAERALQYALQFLSFGGNTTNYQKARDEWRKAAGK